MTARERISYMPAGRERDRDNRQEDVPDARTQTPDDEQEARCNDPDRERSHAQAGFFLVPPTRLTDTSTPVSRRNDAFWGPRAPTAEPATTRDDAERIAESPTPTTSGRRVTPSLSRRPSAEERAPTTSAARLPTFAPALSCSTASSVTERAGAIV